MRYAQIASGQKLHLVCDAGEVFRGKIILAGRVSFPLCGRDAAGGYRMTINVPLGNACKNCARVWHARPSTEGSDA